MKEEKEMAAQRELLARILAEDLLKCIDTLSSSLRERAESTAIQALGEIQAVLKTYDPQKTDPAADFTVIEKIMHILETYGLSTGTCHDFG